MSEGRPSKRRKGKLGYVAWPERNKTVFLRLLASDQVKFELDSPIFMQFGDIDYLKFNSRFASYLYYICACLFEVVEEDMTLYFSEKQRALKDDDDDWEPVEWEDVIQVGEYLVVFESGASMFLLPDISDHLVPNLDLHIVKPRKTVAAATEERLTPSPSSAPFGTRAITMMPPTVSSSTGGSPQSIKSNQSSVITDFKRTDQDPRTCHAIVSRDMSCVVTNVSNDMCNCSHIIPVALLKVPILA